MDCSRHTVTKYLFDEKTHSAINSKMFKRLNHNTDQLYKVKLVKPEIQRRYPVSFGFFSTICQTENVGNLLLYCKFFKKFCDTDRYEKREMDRLLPLGSIGKKTGKLKSF